MSQLNEWKYYLWLVPMARQAIERDYAEHLMDIACDWAYEREYGIGGGVGRKFNWKLDGDDFLTLNFGLCATRENQFIPEADAQSLLDLLREKTAKENIQIQGGFGPFPPM